MQFKANLFLSLALALSASAAPLVADSTPVVANSEANARQSVLPTQGTWSTSFNHRLIAKPLTHPQYDRANLLPKIDAWCA
jgi:hypothetical protein